MSLSDLGTPVLIVWNREGDVKLYGLVVNESDIEKIELCDNVYLFCGWDRKNQCDTYSLVAGLPEEHKTTVFELMNFIRQGTEQLKPLSNLDINLADYSKLIVCGIKYGG